MKELIGLRTGCSPLNENDVDLLSTDCREAYWEAHTVVVVNV